MSEVTYPNAPLSTDHSKAKAGWWGDESGCMSVPTINLGAAREANLADNLPAKFDIRDNPSADGSEPIHSMTGLGSSAVKKHSKFIESESKAQGVDPDLVKAIMFVENAQGGHYGAVTELFRVAESFLPMNIKAGKWKKLGLTAENVKKPEPNIRAGITLIKRIVNRIPDPTVAKVASIYNFAGRETVNDYGARVATVYGKKPWK